MKLGQIKHDGRTVAAIFEGGAGAAHSRAHALRFDSPLGGGIDFAFRAWRLRWPAAMPSRPRRSSRFIPWRSGRAAAPTKPAPAFAMPSTARAKACTRTSIAATGRRFSSKAPSRVCVGPGQPIGLRADSKFTAPEPELAVILGSRGAILGLHAGQRRFRLGHRARERALPAAIENVFGLLRAGTGDRDRG